MIAVQGAYLAGTWIQIFFTVLIDNPVSPSFGAILTFAILLGNAILFYPVSFVADRIQDGLFRVMAIGCAYMILLPLPLMYIIQLGSEFPFGVVIGHFCINFGVVLYGSPLTAWMVQKFPVALRYSALAISYNTAQMLFASMTPLLATAISCASKYRILGGLLFLVTAIVSGLTIIVADKTIFGRRAFAKAIEERQNSNISGSGIGKPDVELAYLEKA